jgi:hypothetical protein
VRDVRERGVREFLSKEREKGFYANKKRKEKKLALAHEHYSVLEHSHTGM